MITEIRLNDIYRMFVRPEGPLGEEAGNLMARTGRAMAQAAVARLGLRPEHHVIEIGFGPGVGLDLIASRVTGGSVVGVDPSATMHGQAAHRNALAIHSGRVRLFEGTVDALPFEDDRFDAGLAIDNMHFWSDRFAGLTELHRVLRHGALFVCAFTPPSGGSMSGMPELFDRAGYTDVSVERSELGAILTATVEK
jgi:ubiquinone/menaquinone biosynthesis C-methylase UbiE